MNRDPEPGARGTSGIAGSGATDPGPNDVQVARTDDRSVRGAREAGTGEDEMDEEGMGMGEGRSDEREVGDVGRVVPDRSRGALARVAGSWETLLLLVAVAIFLINVQASPYFLDPWNLSDATFNFTEKAMIAFAMALLIVSGEIDLSVASIIALASTAMGFAVQFGAGTPALVAIGLGTGLLCGAFNGLLVARLGLPSIVVTIGTLSLFRGIAYAVLGDQAYSGYPASFAFFGQGYVFWVITFEICLFLVAAVAFAVLLHATSFGRAVQAIGNNPTAALFSGIRVPRVKFMLFLLTGLMSGVAAICLTSRLGSTRPSIASGWELEIVTMVVLGGVNILGGSGRIPGVALAAIIMGMVTFGLGLLNVPGIVMSIFVGLLLIGVIALPILFRGGRERLAQRRRARASALSPASSSGVPPHAPSGTPSVPT